MLLAFVVLLALSTHRVDARAAPDPARAAGERVDGALVQEVDEFRALADDGRNPLTGEPFGGDVRSLFDVFLLRNVPIEGEAIFTFVDGRPYESTGTGRAAAARAACRSSAV